MFLILSGDTNYDIERLGLTAKAAERLYTGEVDPVVVSQLLEHKDFAILVKQIAQFKDVTIAAGIAGTNTMISQLGNLVQHVGNKNPQMQRTAIQTRQEIEEYKIPEGGPDTSAMEETFLRIVKDLRNGADAYIAESKKLTTEVMMQVATEHEETRGTETDRRDGRTDGGVRFGYDRSECDYEGAQKGSTNGFPTAVYEARERVTSQRRVIYLRCPRRQVAYIRTGRA